MSTKTKLTLHVLAMLISLCFLSCAYRSTSSLPEGSDNSKMRKGTRRALLIGINKYEVNRDTDRATNLEGAVNDVEAMEEILRTRFGFTEIEKLTDGQATRKGILDAIDHILIARAKPGDFSVFFYSGHGSWSPNRLAGTPGHEFENPEIDHKDETIVPADTNYDPELPDVHDKELAVRFNALLAHKSQLVAIFDSCHSGSIARVVGYPGDGRVRLAPPRMALPLNIASLAKVPTAESQGALILSAVQDYQVAYEIDTESGARGALTYALQQSLASLPLSTNTVDLQKVLLGTLRPLSPNQDPVLAGLPWRRRQPLFGGLPSTAEDRPQVAVAGWSGAYVEVHAGLAIGIGIGAELSRKVDGVTVRLRVTEVRDLGHSRAKILVGERDQIHAGALFQIESWGRPAFARLTAYLPEGTPSYEEVRRIAAVLSPLRSEFGWVADPTIESPTHVLRWQGGQFELVFSAPPRRVALGKKPTAEQVVMQLKAETRVRLFIEIPLPREFVNQLRLGDGSVNSQVRIVRESRYAEYRLVGRIGSAGLEAAWIHPNALQKDATAIPAGTSWAPVHDDRTVGTLEQQALRLAKIKGWLELHTPPGRDKFPYTVGLRPVEDEGVSPARAPSSPDQPIITAGMNVHIGRRYELLLLSKSGLPQEGVEPRFIYIFTIDQFGATTLLFPPVSAGNVENHFPDPRDGSPRLSAAIPLLNSVDIKPPARSETLIMVTSATALPAPDAVFQFDGVRSSQPPPEDEMSQMLSEVGERPRALSYRPPANWSIEHVVVQSLP